MQRSNFWTTLLIRFEQGWRTGGVGWGAEILLLPLPDFQKSAILGQFGMTDRRIYIWDKFSSQKTPKHEKKSCLVVFVTQKTWKPKGFARFRILRFTWRTYILVCTYFEIMQSLNILKRPQKFQPISNLI